MVDVEREPLMKVCQFDGCFLGIHIKKQKHKIRIIVKTPAHMLTPHVKEDTLFPYYPLLD